MKTAHWLKELLFGSSVRDKKDCHPDDFSQAIDLWNRTDESERVLIFSEQPPNAPNSYLLGCAHFRSGGFAESRRAFANASEQLSTMTSARLMACTADNASRSGIKLRTSINGRILPPDNSLELIQIGWQCSRGLGILEIPKEDPSNRILIWALSVSAHLGSHVRSPGEVVARVLNMIHYRVLEDILPSGYCIWCGYDLRFQQSNICPGCERQDTRQN